MTKTEVMALLKKNQNERGKANFHQLGTRPKGMKSFGIGLTQLRKLAKQVGRDHKLAQQLWKSNVYDARVLGLLIDEPKKLTREQVEGQVEDVHIGMLAHVFASCDATLAKAPFAIELAPEWVKSKDNNRRRCGYGLLYELSKSKNKALDDNYFQPHIDKIEKKIQKEDNWVKESMLGALLGIGKRNKKLNRACIKTVKAVGKIEVDYGEGNSCETTDVLKHLTSDYIKKKFAG